jgi:hypothetical protein
VVRRHIRWGQEHVPRRAPDKNHHKDKDIIEDKFHRWTPTGIRLAGGIRILLRARGPIWRCVCVPNKRLVSSSFGPTFKPILQSACERPKQSINQMTVERCSKHISIWRCQKAAKAQILAEIK